MKKRKPLRRDLPGGCSVDPADYDCENCLSSSCTWCDEFETDIEDAGFEVEPTEANEE